MFLPNSIQIQTIDFCNRKCSWCPNSKMEKSEKNLMEISVFEKILNDLKSAGYTGKLHLYLMAEPLCDPRIKDLIWIARKIFPENVIFISTNGDKLNGLESVKSLLDSGLTWMAISDYDNTGRFSKYTAIFPEVVVSSLGKLKETFYNRGGNVEVECEAPRPQCEWIHQKAYINYRGDVILCCSDYEYSVVFGSVMDRSFGDIYNSENYRQYRKAHAMGRGKEMPLCESCNRIS